MIYCPACGTPCPAGTDACAKCKTELPILDETSSSPPVKSPSLMVKTTSPEDRDIPLSDKAGPAPPSASDVNYPSSPPSGASWWTRIEPDWKASLTFLWAWLSLGMSRSMISSMGGGSCTLSFPFYVIMSLWQGMYVGKLASQDKRYSESDILRLGAYSAVWTILLDLVGFMIILIVILGLTGTDLLVIRLPRIIVVHLGAYAAKLFLVTLGAELYRRQRGENLTRLLIIVSLVGTIVLCMVIMVAVVLLAAPRSPEYLP
jgi:hypothetical protein